MTNAELIFGSIKSYADITGLVGRQEDIFLDFKERDSRWRSLGKLSDDEKRLFSKAASGFAHQEGGVLVWGVEARKNTQDIDQAQTLKPFEKVKQFKQALEEHIKFATEPPLDGIRHNIIFENDDEASNAGYVTSYFPKSSRVHRALSNTTSDFYKRHGDSFTPLSTEEIRSLFFRTLAPDLELVAIGDVGNLNDRSSIFNYKFGLKNNGAGVAKFSSVLVGFESPDGIQGVQEFDGQGNEQFKLGKIIPADLGHYGKQFLVNGDIVIFPEQTLMLFSFLITTKGRSKPAGLKYKIFAENMIPKEGKVLA